jgi:hypothetical protein
MFSDLVNGLSDQEVLMNRVVVLAGAAIAGCLLQTAPGLANTGMEWAHGDSQTAACQLAQTLAHASANSTTNLKTLVGTDDRKVRIHVQECFCERNIRKGLPTEMRWQCSVDWGIGVE